MWYYQDFSGDDLREAINSAQRFEALLAMERERALRFSGSMRYAERKGTLYLLRRKGRSRSDQSLGPKSPENDAILAAFQSGKDALGGRIDGIRKDIEARRALIRAHGLGRVPRVAARLLRRLDEVGWLGGRLFVVGTSALFAYEMKAGVRIASGALATEDVDVLHDVRRRVVLGGHELPENGLIGILRKADPSFAPIGPNSFRALNKDGFMVDLIEPIRGDRMRQRPSRLSPDPADLQAVAIDGLQWLVNGPKFEAIVFDETGIPLRLPTVDPRVFALHKIWLSRRADREAIKRRRDALQAEIAASLASHRLGLDFEADDLSALPVPLRALAKEFPMEDEQDKDLW